MHQPAGRTEARLAESARRSAARPRASLPGVAAGPSPQPRQLPLSLTEIPTRSSGMRLVRVVPAAAAPESREPACCMLLQLDS
jgi:hypothetical protein